MNAEIQSVSPTRSVLSISVAPEEAAKARAAVVRDYAARAAIPGFRPGKAPASLVERKFGDRIAAEAVAKAEGAAYDKAVEENKLDVLEIVSVDDRSTAPDGSLSFKVTVDLKPQFELPPLEGIPVDDEDTAVTDDQVQAQLDSILRARSTFVPAPEGAEAQKDDSLEVSFEGRAEDGRPLKEAVPDAASFASRESSKVVAGGEWFMVPGLPAALVGAKAGDEKEVPVEFPADFFKESLRGVKAVYSVKVKSVSRLVPPALDKDFFAQIGVEDEADLRARLRKSLEDSAARRDRARRMDQVARYLANSVKADVPQSALDRETERVTAEMLRFNMDKGVAKEVLSKERERIQESAREQAAARIRTDFALDAAREKLGVTLSTEEFQGYMGQVVAQMGLSTAQVKQLGKDRDALRRYHSMALREKVVAELLKSAKPTAGVK